MGRARRGRRTPTGRKSRISFKLPPEIRRALDKARDEVKTVHVVGGVKGGKLEIHHKELAAVIRKSPRSKIAFVALNAPFKTRALTGSL